MKKIKLLAICLMVLSLSLALAPLAYGHGDDNTVQSQTVGDYIIEFEYQGKEQIQAGKPYNYVFYLLNKDTREQVPTDSMYIRFQNSSSQLVMGANLKSANGLSGNGRINGVMPSAGDYTATLEFYKGQDKVSDASFKSQVAPGGAPEETKPADNETGGTFWGKIFLWLILLVVGFVGGVLTQKWRKIK